MQRFVFLIVSLVSGLSPCYGTVDLVSTQPIEIPVDNVTPKMTPEEFAKVVPANSFVPGSAPDVLASKMADITVNYWMNTPEMKASALGHFAERTQEKLKTDVVVPASEKSGISHKFTFKVEPFQTLAKMEYTGWINAAVNYNAKDTGTIISVKEKLFTNKELTLSHESNKDKDLSMIALAWKW